MMFNFKYIHFIFNNNFFLIKIRFRKIKIIEYDHDFSNLYFCDFSKLKKILINNDLNLNEKKFNNEHYDYHSFNWIKLAKNSGGAELVKVTRNKIINWISINHKFTLYTSNLNLVAKRTLNLIYNYWTTEHLIKQVDAVNSPNAVYSLIETSIFNNMVNGKGLVNTTNQAPFCLRWEELVTVYKELTQIKMDVSFPYDVLHANPDTV